MEWVLLGLFFGFVGYLLFFNLSDFTGLHRDEAWFGLKAVELAQDGVTTLHGMRVYTSSIYSIMIAATFHLGGVSIFSMRILSAVCNLLGLLITAWNSYQYAGKRGLYAVGLLLLSCISWFLFARIAWEVCAFHFLLISIQIWILSHLIYRQRLPYVHGVMFLSVALFGVFNHIIYTSNLCALLLSAIIMGALTPPKPHPALVKLMALAAFSLGYCIYLFAIKLTLSDLFVQRNALLVVLLLVWPILVGPEWISRVSDHSQSIRLGQWLDLLKTKFAVVTPARRALGGLLVFPLVAIFLIRHLWGFVGTISGVLPVQRILVQELGLWQRVIFLVGWLSILSIVCLAGYRKITRLRSASATAQLEVLWFLYPLLSVLLLSIFTLSNASRHYLVAVSLLLCCLPLVSADLVAVVRKPAAFYLAVCMGLNVVTGQGILSHALLNGHQDPPFQIHFVTYQDTAGHFYKLAPLQAYLHREQTCQFANTNEFIQEPLQFLFLASPYHCDRNRTATITYCADCQEPVPHFTVDITENRDDTINRSSIE